MPAKTETKAVGFKIACPHCGDSDEVNVNVKDLNIYCYACSEDISREQLEQQAAEIARLLRWLDAAGREEG